MLGKDPKTTVFGWMAGIALLLSNSSSPIAPLIPPEVKKVAEFVSVVSVGMLGTHARDAKKEGEQ